MRLTIVYTNKVKIVFKKATDTKTDAAYSELYNS